MLEVMFAHYDAISNYINCILFKCYIVIADTWMNEFMSNYIVYFILYYVLFSCMYTIYVEWSRRRVEYAAAILNTQKK